jgi:hypothetical protein
MAEDLLEYARKLESQFQFYVISLIFTLLAASIQTANLGKSKIQDIAEIVAWLCLLSSGLFALSYAEWRPVAHRNIGRKRAFSKRVAEAVALRKSTPRDVLIARTHQNTMSDESIQSDRKLIEDLETTISSLARKSQKKYGAAKFLFTTGLTLVVVSRSAETVASLFGFRLL